jgi:Tfp pilus assembly protein FimT
MIIVLIIMAIILAASLPQMISARRALRSTAITRQVMAQLRLVRQEAMSQRQAMTLQYDDVNKQLVVIDHQASGRALLSDTNYPNTPGSVQVRTIPLAGGGVPAGEIAYGIPSGMPATALGALGDTTTLTTLNTTTKRINITFQPDGSVIDSAGTSVNYALYFYNVKIPSGTASAISVLGSGGRAKLWRYDSNASSYVE